MVGCIWKIASAPVPFLRFEMSDDIDTSNKDLRSKTSEMRLTKGTGTGA